MRKKYLVLGSAPTVTEWCERNLDKALQVGMFLCAINNAWSAHSKIPGALKIWFHSKDFFNMHPLIQPTDEDRDKWYEITQFISYPVWYDARNGGAMILSTLCHLVNCGENNDRKVEIYVAGNNLIYDKEKTHFYGKGTADPLRLGADFLKNQLCRLNGYAETQGHKIYNADYQEGTLLPFERIDL